MVLKQSVITRILEHNKKFVTSNASEPFKRGNKPSEKLAIVACMDNRLITMLTAAMGLDNGEASIIKVAGAEIRDPYGAVMRSLLVGIYELGIEKVMIIAHTDCGAQHMSSDTIKEHMREAGISQADIDEAARTTDLDTWLEGFGHAEAAVKQSVETVRSHPLVSDKIQVSGFIIDTQTGELTQLI